MSESTIQPPYSEPEGLPVESEAPVDPSATSRPVLPAAHVRPEPDRIVRGILLSLLVIPVGIVAWVLIWSAGYVASIVSFGVAFGAVSLFRIGSRQAKATWGAFWALIGVILVTVVLSFIAGLFSDLVSYAAITWNQALTSPAFWSMFWDDLFTNSALWADYAPQFGLALLFAALGCFGTIRRLAREASA